MKSIPAFSIFCLYLYFSIFPEFGNCHVEDSELFPYDSSQDTRYMFGDDTFTRYDFGVPFNFFNGTYESVFISGNGQVSFEKGISDYTAACTPSIIPMIMVYWTDSNNNLDTVNCKLLFYETTDRALLRKATRDVFKAFPGFKGISLSWAFIVTWKELPFFGANNTCDGLSKRNTFQLILTSDGVHSFALMYYNKIEWTTGTASSGNCYGLGGMPAKAGFDYGDKKFLYTVPGSCENSILNITQTSNIGEPGKWVFRIDSNLRTASCKEYEGERQKLKLSPSVVSTYGNTPLKVIGPCLAPTDKVFCTYSDQSSEVEMEGIVTSDSKSVICPMPFFDMLGRKTVTLKVLRPMYNDNESGGETIEPEIVQVRTYTGYIYVVNDIFFGKRDRVKVSFNVSPEDNATIIITAEWDPLFVGKEMEILYKSIEQSAGGPEPEKLSVMSEPLDLILEKYDGNSWREFGVVKSKIENTGLFNGNFDSKLVADIINLRNPEALTLSISRSSSNKPGRRNYNKLFAETLSFAVKIYEVISILHPAVFKVARRGNSVCKAWSFLEGPVPIDTRPCPRTRSQAENDRNFEEDKATDWMPFFHPGGDYSVRQKVASESGAGSQCVYNKRGNLMIGPPGGGTLDRYSPNRHPAKHILFDVLPYIICCKLSGFLNTANCRKQYYKHRPSDDGSNYRSPRVIRAVGDPHITTLDGLSYTFNSIGEFWMINMENQSENLTFRMQARMEQYISPERVPMNASVFTAAVMEEIRGTDKATIQISYSSEKILVAIDGEIVDVGDANSQTAELTLHHKTSQVILTSAQIVTVVFSSGFSFRFSTIGGDEVALNILGIGDARHSAVVRGLMGNCDGDMTNDLMRPDGTTLPINSTLQDIHYSFGLQWMINESESLFAYPPGKSYSDYAKPDFQPSFISDFSSISQNILDICEDNTDCMFDYVTTGSRTLANETKTRNVEYDQTVSVLSIQAKMCPSVQLLRPENGYLMVTHMQIGGVVNFYCNSEYVMAGGDANCTCTADSSDNDAAPVWACNRQNPFPIQCVSKEVQLPLFCDPPPSLINGVVEGTNFSIGAAIKFQCINDDYELFWKNCRFNGEDGICNEFCEVTYTCALNAIAGNDSTLMQATWEGVGGDIADVICHSKVGGIIATRIRKLKTMIINNVPDISLIPESIMNKPYLTGC